MVTAYFRFKVLDCRSALDAYYALLLGAAVWSCEAMVICAGIFFAFSDGGEEFEFLLCSSPAYSVSVDSQTASTKK